MINIDILYIHHTFLLFDLRNIAQRVSGAERVSVANLLETKPFLILSGYVTDVKKKNLIKIYSCS
ncbi:hypothetical protein FB99_07860 [Pantoea agglomerans]|nr:hypothetical protein FB99_07860 [Pantoea agglomerans]